MTVVSSPATLKDVASRLGIHPSTVSRALRRDPRIGVGTREQVQKVCKELGYEPNSAFSQLAHFRWNRGQVGKGISIAYVDQDASEVMRDIWIFALREQATLLGYHLEIFDRAHFASSAKLQRALRSRGITDVILGPGKREAPPIELDWPKFICVQMIPGFSPLPLHGVVRDHFGSVTLAWAKAVEYGYRRIGVTLLRHPVQIADDFMRQAAATACQTQLFPHLPVIPLFYNSPDDVRSGDFIPWVEKHDLDVVIAFNGVPYRPWLESKFGSRIAFATLHKSEWPMVSQAFIDENKLASISGVLDTTIVCARESVNFLHACRRTYQWGIPQNRIDHVIQPVWSEGMTMPRKKG